MQGGFGCTVVLSVYFITRESCLTCKIRAKSRPDTYNTKNAQIFCTLLLTKLNLFLLCQPLPEGTEVKMDNLKMKNYLQLLAWVNFCMTQKFCASDGEAKLQKRKKIEHQRTGCTQIRAATACSSRMKRYASLNKGFTCFSAISSTCMPDIRTLLCTSTNLPLHCTTVTSPAKEFWSVTWLVRIVNCVG